jgi:hypothetical protein
MNEFRQASSGQRRRGGGQRVRRVAVALLLTLGSGCGRDAPPARVEGALRMDGRPLEQCLITFLPEPGHAGFARHASGVTDQQGRYGLRLDDQRLGASLGWHRVLVQDLTVSTGVVRRDHGELDRKVDGRTPRPARRSRVPARYASPTETPLRCEVVAGPQVIDLEIEH